MEKRKYFCLLLSFLFFLPQFVYPQERRNPFLVEWNDSVQKVRPGEVYTLRVNFKVPEGHYLYADKTEIKLSQLGPFKEIKREIPKPEKHFDSFLNQETDVYLHDFEVKILLKAATHSPLGRTDLEGEIKYQGCSSDFCYRPMKAALLVPLDITKNTSVLSQTQPSTGAVNQSVAESKSTQNTSPQVNSVEEGFWSLLFRGQIEKILDQNIFWVMIFVFLLGLLTAFSPCVLPVIPLTLAVVGIKKDRTFLHNVGLSTSLVMGMSLTYAALGLAAVLLGLKLGFLFQNQFFLGFLVVFFVTMSLSLWGFFQIEVPLRWRNFFANLGGSGFKGAFLAGLSIGFIASPCVGPVIGPILFWVAQKQKLIEGMFILFVYGLGMGSLFIVMGTFYSTLAGKLRGGHYTIYIKRFLAFLMLLPALYYSYVLYQQYKPASLRSGWSHSLQEGFAKAKEEQKPVIIDFYADWCIPCIEIDQKTMKDPRVIEALRDFVPIKINCTLESPECQEATEKYNVIGWPTLYFLNSSLDLQKDLSVVGQFVSPERMLEILKELKNRNSL